MKTKFSIGRQGFTLVEIMIVVAIIALLAAVGIPGFLRARKRSQASRIINDLRLIDGAVDAYAIENAKSTGNPVFVTDWTIRRSWTILKALFTAFPTNIGSSRIFRPR